MRGLGLGLGLGLARVPGVVRAVLATVPGGSVVVVAGSVTGPRNVRLSSRSSVSVPGGCGRLGARLVLVLRYGGAIGRSAVVRLGLHRYGPGRARTTGQRGRARQRGGGVLTGLLGDVPLGDRDRPLAGEIPAVLLVRLVLLRVRLLLRLVRLFSDG